MFYAISAVSKVSKQGLINPVRVDVLAVILYFGSELLVLSHVRFLYPD